MNDTTPDGDRVNILVVDDVPQNLLAMKALLQAADVQVICARSGAEALEMLLVNEVALALLDVQMPEIDGFALAELMRGAARTREIPIIFLTASPTDPARSFKGYEAGAVDFLHKPIHPLVIASKVKVFVELYRQRRLLGERNAELERLLKLNETMIAVLSHDLRTPLSSIVTCAEIVNIQARDDAARAVAARLKRSGSRMARMIDQLLDFSRIRSGVLQLQLQRADLGAVCASSLAEHRDASRQGTVQMTSEGDLQGVFDADRLEQVLSNLIGNALRHGDASMPVQVRLDGRDPDMLRASVLNAGRVPDEVVARLFSAFKSGSQADQEGLGLGLYIVDQFVRAHGGRVGGRNTDEGVLFELEFPRAGRETRDARMAA